MLAFLFPQGKGLTIFESVSLNPFEVRYGYEFWDPSPNVLGIAGGMVSADPPCSQPVAIIKCYEIGDSALFVLGFAGGISSCGAPLAATIDNETVILF